MRLIRHLLSHLLLISVIAGICAVYFYRNQVLPEQYVQKIDRYAERIHPRLVTVASKRQVNESSVQVESSEIQQDMKAESKPEVVAVEEESPGTGVTEALMVGQENDPMDASSKDIAQADEKNANDVAMTDVPAAPIVPDEKTVAVVNNPEVLKPAENEKIMPVTASSEESPATDKDAAGSHELLRAARNAFNNGELDTAIARYNELIELENDEADFYGELGNVHYAMGNWNMAGVAYYEAATRLIETGNLAQVSYLQRVLQGLDAERAEQLYKQLATVNQGQ